MPAPPEHMAGVRQTDSQSIFAAISGLLREFAPSRIVLLLLLMIAVALTDGIGIVMLVPLLGTMGGGKSDGLVAKWLQTTGLQGDLATLLALFVALVIVRAILVFSLGQLRLRMQHTFVDQMRQRCYKRLLGAEWRWLSGQHAGDQNATLLTNIATVGVGFDQLVGLCATVVLAAAYGVVALYLSWPTTLLAMALGAVAFVALAGFRRRATVFGRDLTQANRDLHRHVQQGLSSIRLAKIFGNEASLDSGFGRAIGAVRDSKLSFSRDTALSQALIQIAAAVLLALLAYAGIAIWAIPLAVLLPLALILIRLAPMLAMIQQGWNSILHALPALDDVRRLLSEAEAYAEPIGETGSVRLRHSITLSAVSFSYFKQCGRALDSVTMTIAAKSTTAICGESGSGKSTLADLLLGLLCPDSGSILIDGQILSDQNRRIWRQNVAYVEQSPTLFHDTIRANLLWGKADASDAELVTALKMASAEFALASPGGLDAIVGDGGMRLSGGERQRITLARALLRQPDLLILDEATSALDPENEAAISRVLAALHGQMTIILIGHRDSIRASADSIFELAGGRVVSQESRQETGRV